MNPEDHFRTLMHELAARLNPGQLRHREPEDIWTIELDGTSRLEIAHDDATHQLIFQFHLGAVPRTRQPLIHEWLLRFNYPWRENGGLHMSLDDAGNAVMGLRWAGLELDEIRLSRLVGAILQQGAAWRDLLAGSASARTSDDLPPPPELPPFGGIRV